MNRPAEIVEVSSLGQLEQVRNLLRSYQKELPTPYRFPDTEWQNLPGDYVPPEGALVLATVAGDAAGCVGLRPFPLPMACEMKRLYVASAFRREHLGHALVEKIMGVARRVGYSRMRLDTHPATMVAAVGLYRRFGFVEVAAEPMPTVEGLAYMERVL
jgi:ribosomal protein S18 acetylase RimI-like enzyme